MGENYYQSNSAGGFTGQDDQKGKNLQILLPTTIKQLSSAEAGPEGGNTFSIDGVPLHRVKVIGQIMGINRQSTTVTLELDDGTGRIDTRFWLNHDPEEEGAEDTESGEWQEGVYVRVFGHLRQFKNSDKNSFVAMSIKPIEDFNEITFHLLEATYVHLKNLQDAQNPTAYSYQQAAPVDTNPYQAGGVAEQPGEDLQPLYATILEIVQRASGTAEGASIAYIAEQMNLYGIDEAQVRQAIEYLTSEGHIYPTVDEEHFKA
mmetsp:Transcript_130420/g.194121  ORF Transcript_130420/g.194121 Transcript_130420/m.194121 type:complete len:261 (-) Transcript_130420:23-805(-)